MPHAAPLNAGVRRYVPTQCSVRKEKAMKGDIAMKRIAIKMVPLLLLASASAAQAQNCKPDGSGLDRISKKQFDVWTEPLFRTGFAASVVGTGQVTVFLSVGRLGSESGVQVTIIKKEENRTKAELESSWRAAKGNKIELGFKDAEGLTFVVSDVTNETRAAGVISPALVTTMSLWAQVPDNELAKLRGVLTGRQLDSYRVTLIGDVTISNAVNAKTGARMMRKFSCFYQFLDKKGINLLEASPSPSNTAEVSSKDGTQKAPSSQITIDQIIQMVEAKLSEEIIINAIRNSGSKYDLTPETLIKLKTVGVSDAIIKAMQAK
jgi:hypothetical protein